MVSKSFHLTSSCNFQPVKFHWFFVGTIFWSHPTSCATAPGHCGIPFADNSPLCANDQLFSWLFIVCRWKWRVALGSYLPVRLIVLWKPRREVDKSLIDSRGGVPREVPAKGLLSLSVHRAVQKKDVCFQSFFFPSSCSFWLSHTTLMEVVVKRLFELVTAFGGSHFSLDILMQHD